MLNEIYAVPCLGELLLHSVWWLNYIGDYIMGCFGEEWVMIDTQTHTHTDSHIHSNNDTGCGGKKYEQRGGRRSDLTHIHIHTHTLTHMLWHAETHKHSFTKPAHDVLHAYRTDWLYAGSELVSTMEAWGRTSPPVAPWRTGQPPLGIDDALFVWTARGRGPKSRARRFPFNTLGAFLWIGLKQESSF